MTIVCGTDFSLQSEGAARAAAALARRLGERLVLVHVAPEAGAAAVPEGDPRREALTRASAELSAEGTDVVALLRSGSPDEVLVDVVRAEGARMLVVSSLGQGKRARWLVGSVAERAAQASPAPVLVVRGNDAFDAFARGERPLRVLLGADPSPASRAAKRWVDDLRRVAPCDVVVAQVVWPIGEHTRLGIGGPIPLDRLKPEVETVLLRELRAAAGSFEGEGAVSFVARPCLGRPDSDLVKLAEELAVDLVVLGMHRRSGVERLLRGSVSSGVLHAAPMSVACVPTSEEPPRAAGDPLPVLRRVLVPTDLSAESSRAVAFGCSLAAGGGSVRLLHVVSADPSEDERSALEARLLALAPRTASERGLELSAEITRAARPADAILQAAERMGADAVCMAARSRKGLAKWLAGSVTAEVLERAGRPVLILPAGSS